MVRVPGLKVRGRDSNIGTRFGGCGHTALVDNVGGEALFVEWTCGGGTAIASVFASSLGGVGGVYFFVVGRGDVLGEVWSGGI